MARLPPGCPLLAVLAPALHDLPIGSAGTLDLLPRGDLGVAFVAGW